MSRRRASCGLDFTCVPNIKGCLNQANENGYSFICSPVAHPRFKRELIIPEVAAENKAFTRSDLVLSTTEWCRTVVGKLSPSYDCDSDDPHFRKQSEAVIQQELMYSLHLSLPAVIFRLSGNNHANLARIIFQKTSHHVNTSFWAHVPMVSPEVQACYYREGKIPLTNTWEWWNEFRLLCNSDKKLGVALELSADMVSKEEQSRWLGEPIKILIISTSLFVTNKKGYPVLSTPHQMFIKKAAMLDVQVVITGANRHPSYKNYMQYIDHLFQTCHEGLKVIPYSSGYEDHLQIPLQPLMDNLESNTYDVFEKDPIKYSEYQSAIYQALIDRVPDPKAQTRPQVVMVVGAGRGPLVTASLNAAGLSYRSIKVYAVEKNPNAIVTLHQKNQDAWLNAVTVVSCDMRDWKAPELCDILVSELLGSFGDNELSPECLDGPTKFLRPDGISIPCEYTSYLRPLQSSKLYNEARNNNSVDKPQYTKFEMPYVVHQLNAYNIAPAQPVFTFHHPEKCEETDHTRYTKLNFKIEQDSVLHGFTGYFDAVLYKNIKLSIVPETYSEGMFSWFPVYFPIKEPLKLRQDDDLEVHFWRLSDKKSVWYEWCISKPVVLGIHNCNGRSYSIGLL